MSRKLGEIVGEKAGIFKVNLEVANMLDSKLLNGLHLGLAGDHQYINAGLAIMLSSTWLQRTDGAHSPESMEVSANWFSIAVGGDNFRKDSAQILLFNYMSVRDLQDVSKRAS
uniref:Uncharacterized protein n=1 Tax=Lactuca sativa TaxID=4236 RepID=A0A9R1WZ80_LACSA|nr:hypothetical protein LSAT_V11C800440230 [Lactuca sativa]